MREFGKTERKSFWQKMWNWLKSLTAHQYGGFSDHNDRMQKRRRKTKFDRWG